MYRLKLIPLLIITLFVVTGCGAIDDPSFEMDDEISQGLQEEPIDDLDAVPEGEFDESEVDLLVTCPVTLSCYSNPPAGSGWLLTSTDFCPGLIKCWWGRFSPPYGSALTYLTVPAECPVCRKSNGSSGTCGVTDPPGPWTCSAQ